MDNQPTPEQVKRYNDLRDAGVSPLEATHTVRSETRSGQLPGVVPPER